MTTYTMAWGWDDDDPSGQHTIRVQTVEDVDTALNRLASDGAVRVIDVYEGVWAEGQPTPPYGFQLVWGHPERAALTWLGDDPAIAADPSLPEWTEPIPNDQDETPPHHTRITPAQVREALHQYIHTRRQPTNVRWEQH
ncbi:Imm1 family immunity protein [Rugosimonospora africana]|uniref:Immunity protein Imm1 n=1 Tax=Rugosimonospora africana TaxID=556532 RepID=A0A8J3VWJ2_9ACTN|nr:Imm1 family immunity protein [Rugosimonospora africana]GIH21370.1 hypothetical protein Raf01_95420 [Rugosimonospora africana]